MKKGFIILIGIFGSLSALLIAATCYFIKRGEELAHKSDMFFFGGDEYFNDWK